MVFKLLAFGVKEYCKNFQNGFDGFLVILSLIEFGLSMYNV